MQGIERIASYVPAGRRENLHDAARFGVDPGFLREKLGVLQRARKADDENTSDLARAACQRLLDDTGLDAGTIDALVVVTQNPDFPIPNT